MPTTNPRALTRLTKKYFFSNGLVSRQYKIQHAPSIIQGTCIRSVLMVMGSPKDLFPLLFKKVVFKCAIESPGFIEPFTAQT